MMASTSATGSRLMDSGVRARAHSAGVTRFTRTSVHCADSTTATSNVKASVCCNGIGVSGYSSASRRSM